MIYVNPALIYNTYPLFLIVHPCICFPVYTGDKKIQSNTNGPMLGQTESGVNRDVIITDSSKEIVHEKVCMGPTLRCCVPLY